LRALKTDKIKHSYS